MIRSAPYAVRRVRQTLAFANGPRVLLDLASGKTPWRRETLTFRTRGGTTISCPNVAGARLAVYEHFIEDTYRLSELTSGLRDDVVVLDVGGQVGAFALAMARHAPRSRIHVYEASPATARWLEKNVATNGLDEQITVHAVAIADRVGTVEFADVGEASVHNGITAPTDGDLTRVEVPSTTFAEAFAAAGGQVDILKMDAEGAEYASILTSPPQLWAGVQRVVMEYHPVDGYSWSDLEDYFAGVGLRRVHHVTEGPGLGLAWLARSA